MLVKTTVDMIKAGGVPDSTTFLRSDQVWATIDGTVSSAPISSLTKVDLNMIEIPGTVTTTSFLRGDGTWTDINTLNGSAPVWGTAQGSIAIANEQAAFTANLIAVDPNGLLLTYTITSGSLPTGLTLNSTSGVITGTTPQVNTNTTSNFTVSVTNGTTATTRNFSITVNNSTNEPPVWSTAAGSIGTVGINSVFNYTLTATDPNNDVISYTITSGSLPAGLSLSTSGIITGTTTAIASTTTSNFTVRANDGMGGTLDRAFSITVSVAAPTVAAFSYTGADQTYVVPAGITSLVVDVWGAGSNVAAGGYTTGTLAVTPGETLTIIVGQTGDFSGWYRGGGRSAIRRGGTELCTAGGAGGGGGDGWTGTGSEGGGLTGGDGVGTQLGYGGTQVGPGSGGGAVPAAQFLGGGGGNSPTARTYGGGGGASWVGGSYNGSGGGGGWYGGGGSNGYNGGNAGGGSGYVGGLVSGTTTKGVGGIPAGNTSSYYAAGIAVGGNGSSGLGGHGRVVLSYTQALLTVVASSGNKDAMNTSVVGGFATLDPSFKGDTVTLSNGNLTAVFANLAHAFVRSTGPIPRTGKWYAEFTCNNSTDSSIGWACGVTGPAALPSFNQTSTWTLSDGILTSVYASSSGTVAYSWGGAGATVASIGPWDAGDVVCIEVEYPTVRYIIPNKGINVALTITLPSNEEMYFYMEGDNCSGVVNFGASAWTRTPSSGYIGIPYGVLQYGSDVTFTLTNTGQAGSSTINYALTNTTNFELHGGTITSGSTTLAGGTSGTVIVRPKASTTGSYTGNLNITANNNPSISMSGTAS